MNIEREFNLARRHKDFNPLVFEKLKGQSDAEILNCVTSESRKVMNWNKQVSFCFHRSRAFARLSISKHGIVFGMIEPEHYVEDMVVRWFRKRFPDFTIMIGSERGIFVSRRDDDLEIYKENMEQVVKKYEEMLPIDHKLSGLEDFNSDEYWKKYYSSQYIKQRRNKKLMLKHMPKKYLRWKSLSIENNSEGKLNHFLENHQ